MPPDLGVKVAVSRCRVLSIRSTPRAIGEVVGMPPNLGIEVAVSRCRALPSRSTKLPGGGAGIAGPPMVGAISNCDIGNDLTRVLQVKLNLNCKGFFLRESIAAVIESQSSGCQL